MTDKERCPELWISSELLERFKDWWACLKPSSKERGAHRNTVFFIVPDKLCCVFNPEQHGEL